MTKPEQQPDSLEQWTAETVDGLLDVSWDAHAWGAIKRSRNSIAVADAHNAALAAERIAADRVRETNRLAIQKIGWLEHQLAAERVTKDNLRVACEDAQQQLAAEREKHRKEIETVTMNTSDVKTVQQLRDQLADHIKAANEVTDENIELERQLSAAQAAIAKHHTLGWNCPSIESDTTALDAYVREKCQPLVDALKQIRYASAPIPQATTEQIAHQPIEAHRIAIDALAKVKLNAQPTPKISD